MAEEIVFDVAEADFEERVIRASHECAIVVDFWAPWCAPCRVISPVLERIVSESGGRAKLARVNLDENRGLAAKWMIQGIPAVKVFREGRVVREFMGALPEDEIRRILSRAIPSEADGMVSEGDGLLEAGQMAEAYEKYQQALVLHPGHPGACVRLAKKALQVGDLDAARKMAGAVEEDDDEYEEASGVVALVKFREECNACGGRETAAKRFEEDDSNLDARFGLAMCLAAEGEYSEALEHLARIVETDRTYGADAPREAMLRIFTIVGSTSELAWRYRKRLASAIY